MKNHFQLSDSLENYLEAILQQEKPHSGARVSDIAERLNVKMPSVTKALGVLAEKELVNYEPYGEITLTDQGREIAKDVFKRHQALKAFLTEVLMIEEKEAEETACKMEHVISSTILDRLLKYVAHLHSCPKASLKWEGSFGFVCGEMGDYPQCDTYDAYRSYMKFRESELGGSTTPK